MSRILVVPEELQSASQDLQRASTQLREIASRYSSAYHRMDWDARAEATTNQYVNQAYQSSESMIRQAEMLVTYLILKSEAYRAADGSGATAIQTMLRSPLMRPLSVQPLLSLFRVPITTGLPWLRARFPELFSVVSKPIVAPQAVPPPVTRPPKLLETRLPNSPEVRYIQQVFGIQEAGYGPLTKQAVRDLQTRRGIPVDDQVMIGPKTWSAIVAHESGGDPFWQGVLESPVLIDAHGQKQLRPGLQEWATTFNRRIEANWAMNPSDHAGTTGVNNLMDTYRMTPDKMEQLWSISRENSIDPKVMLSILQQEGTGSFNTNGSNSAHYGNGHGPQPNFDQDIKAALHGPILSKLRLYPQAVQSGFPGNWVEWVNWHTPIDSRVMGGASGVYAQDINWAQGVERHYRSIDAQLGGTSGDPVKDYSDWMGRNSDMFTPNHIQGEFEIRPGHAPGTVRPELALHQSYPKPNYPETAPEPREGFWRFPAPEKFLWHIVKK